MTPRPSYIASRSSGSVELVLSNGRAGQAALGPESATASMLNQTMTILPPTHCQRSSEWHWMP